MAKIKRPYGTLDHPYTTLIDNKHDVDVRIQNLSPKKSEAKLNVWIKVEGIIQGGIKSNLDWNYVKTPLKQTRFKLNHKVGIMVGPMFSQRHVKVKANNDARVKQLKREKRTDGVGS